MASSSSSSSESSSDQAGEHLCFQKWMALQQFSLSELLQALKAEDDGGENKEDLLRRLVEKNLKHFEEYAGRRIRLARDDVSAYFAPTWCSSLESSLLWLAGCRPSSFIRLVYSLCGAQIESQLGQILQGVTSDAGLGELSAQQLILIDNLHIKTIREERRLSDRIASLQDNMADQQIAKIAKQMHGIFGQPNAEAEVDAVLIEHDKSMVKILEEADKLRLDTLSEITNILTPFQAADFLAAGKQLHLCIQKLGAERDRSHGRN